MAGLIALLTVTRTALAQAPLPPAAEKPKPTEDTTVLNVFEVSADKDDSYGALNSNSITRFNTELAKLPITADIYNEAFMRDVNASSVESMIASFTAGAGFSSSDGPASTLAAQPGDRASNSYIQLRGLTAPGMQRDAFMTLATFSNTGSTATGQTNNFDIERTEVIMGPQALLYGNGGGGGVVISSRSRRGLTANPVARSSCRATTSAVGRPSSTTGSAIRTSRCAWPSSSKTPAAAVKTSTASSTASMCSSPRGFSTTLSLSSPCRGRMRRTTRRATRGGKNRASQGRAGP